MPIFQKGKLRLRLVTKLVKGVADIAQGCLTPRPALLTPGSLLSVFPRQLIAVTPQGTRAAWLWWLRWENGGTRGRAQLLLGETDASCWETDTSCLPGRGLSVPALQLLHPSPTEGLDPHAPRTTHALPRGTPHHQGHPLHRGLLRRSI